MITLRAAVYRLLATKCTKCGGLCVDYYQRGHVRLCILCATDDADRRATDRQHVQWEQTSAVNAQLLQRNAELRRQLGALVRRGREALAR